MYGGLWYAVFMEKTVDNVVAVLDQYFEDVPRETKVVAAEEFLKRGTVSGELAVYEQDGDDKWYIVDVLDFAFNRYNPSGKQLFQDNAEKIPVKIGGRVYQTFLDERGVQRFVTNSVINQIIDWDGDRSLHGSGEDYILNRISIAYQEGQFSEEDMLDFYTSFGYSVSGLVSLSYFEHLPVENPLWDK